MRVLHLTHNYPRFPGDPSGSFIEGLLRVFDKDEVKSFVLCPGAPGLAERETRSGIQIRRFRYAEERRQTLAYEGKMLDALKGGVTGLGLVASMIKAFGSAARRIVCREGIDIVHTHWLIPGGLAARMALAGSRTPMVVSTHGTDVRMLTSLPGGGMIAGWILGRAAAVLPVSGFLADRLRKMAGEHLPVEILPMPASEIFISQRRKTLREPVIAVGNLTVQKRFNVLIEALAILGSQGFLPELILVGDGPQRQSLERLAEDRGVKVDFTGRVPHDELPAVLNRAGVMVLPSVGEGFGVALVEAQLAGLAVIGARAGGQEEIIEQGETGMLVEPDDPHALAEAVRKMYSNERKTLQMASQGQEKAKERFLPRPTAQRLMHIYRRILQGK